MSAQQYQKGSQSYSPRPEPMPIKLEDIPIARALANKSGIDDTRLRLILSVCPPGSKDHEVAALIYNMVRTGLDPLARQIYLVSRGGKSSVQTGIDGYRLIADRTGQYIGSDDPVYDEGLTQYEMIKSGREHPETATVTVSKVVNGIVGKFTATAAWSAYYPGESQGYMWKKMGMLMLAKTGEALALRKAFPAELSGIYISEEMMQAGDSEGDANIDAITRELGFLNKNAPLVKEKLDEIGVATNDPLVIKMIGCPVEEVPGTPEGSDLLQKLWTAAVSVKKGAPKEDAFK